MLNVQLLQSEAGACAPAQLFSHNKNSVGDAITDGNRGVLNKTMSQVEAAQTDFLKGQGVLMTDTEAASKLREFRAKVQVFENLYSKPNKIDDSNVLNTIKAMDETFGPEADKLYYSHHKAEFYLMKSKLKEALVRKLLVSSIVADTSKPQTSASASNVLVYTLDPAQGNKQFFKVNNNLIGYISSGGSVYATDSQGVLLETGVIGSYSSLGVFTISLDKLSDINKTIADYLWKLNGQKFDANGEIKITDSGNTATTGVKTTTDGTQAATIPNNINTNGMRFTISQYISGSTSYNEIMDNSKDDKNKNTNIFLSDAIYFIPSFSQPSLKYKIGEYSNNKITLNDKAKDYLTIEYRKLLDGAQIQGNIITPFVAN
mgnify:CR=1 FL=1